MQLADIVNMEFIELLLNSIIVVQLILCIH